MATEVRERVGEATGQAAHDRTIERYREYVTSSFVAAIDKSRIKSGTVDRIRPASQAGAPHPARGEGS